jgi:hypothetical protein
MIDEVMERRQREARRLGAGSVHDQRAVAQGSTDRGCMCSAPLRWVGGEGAGSICWARQGLVGRSTGWLGWWAIGSSPRVMNVATLF